MEEFRVEEVQDIFYDGHDIHCSVRLPIFGNTLPLNFERWFSFHCPVLSTSFMFRMTFQRAPNKGGLDCVVLIKRTDDIGIRVDGDFWMSAFTKLRDVQVPSRCIRLDGMPRFAQTTNIVEAFVPKDILTQLGGSYILFYVRFIIRGCHRGMCV